MTNPFFYDEADIAERQNWNKQNATNYCSLAVVKAINASPVSVDIQPLVKYFDTISNWEEFPVLKNVPIIQFQSKIHSINLPVNVGDTGMVLWFDREVYTALLGDGFTPITPDSGSLNDDNACVFLPVMPLFSLANPLKPSGIDIVSSEISLMTQLITLLTDLNTFLAALIAAGAPYAGAPSTPVVGAYPIAITAASTLLETAVTTITAALTTFKGAQL